MPKPTTYQRPIPVNRSRNGRPGVGAPPPFGQPGKKDKPSARPAQPGVRLNLDLPRLPPLKP